MTIRSRPIVVLGMLFSLFRVCAADADVKENYFGKSLDELLAVDVSVGSLTGTEALTAPVSVTIVTAEDIAVTPARNILDLIEIYVPGATYVYHYNGPRLGMRGVLGDQNASYIVQVNGRKANWKAETGAFLELENRDLHDIERVEIIRGPSSATYGPGAVGGIINILTRTASTAAGTGSGADFHGEYRYGGAYLRHAHQSDRYHLFLYGGINASDGQKETDLFYAERAHGWGWGFYGDSNQWPEKWSPVAPHWYEDFLNKPQLKFHLDLAFTPGPRLWMRYTSFSQPKLVPQVDYADGPGYLGHSAESFAIALDDTLEITDAASLESVISFGSMNIHNLSYAYDDYTQEDPLQLSDAYSENEIELKSILRYESSETMRYALGASFGYQFWRPAWGEDKRDFIMRNWILADDAPRYQTFGPDSVVMLDDSIDATLLAIFGEASLQLMPELNVLLSARADKHELADWVYSPRLALTLKASPKDTLQFIAQRSVHLPMIADLYSAEMAGNREGADSGKLTGFEMIYNRLQFENTHMRLSSYINRVEQIEWLPVSSYSGILGTCDLFGVDAEFSHRVGWADIGVSYAFIHQMDWDPKEMIPVQLKNLEGDPMPVAEWGENRINNLPAHTLKGFANMRLCDGLLLHVNGRLFWGYGQDDMLDIYEDAHERYGTAESLAEMRAIYGSMADEGYGEPSFTLNASLQWTLPVEKVDAKLTFYAMNLLSYNHIRYIIQYWETARAQYPRQCSFMEEPLSLGIRLDFAF